MPNSGPPILEGGARETFLATVDKSLSSVHGVGDALPCRDLCSSIDFRVLLSPEARGEMTVASVMRRVPEMEARWE